MLTNLPIPPRVAKRAAERYVADDAGHWITTTALLDGGYGQISWRDETGTKRHTTVHRAAWVHHNGPIPDDYTVDHRCRVRSCVNPTDLRLLTLSENGEDGNVNRRSTAPEVGRQCSKGHPLTQRSPDVPARCLTCNNDNARRRRAARRAA